MGTQQQSRPQANQQTHEMTVPNELIGCIIGKGGSKIAEIRWVHGGLLSSLHLCAEETFIYKDQVYQYPLWKSFKSILDFEVDPVLLCSFNGGSDKSFQLFLLILQIVI